MQIYKALQERNKVGQKSLAVLIDPDKVTEHSSLLELLNMAKESCVDFFFVGGSLITQNNIPDIVGVIREGSNIPIVLFPGSNMHIDLSADAILFLSLISGRNPELLIGQHVAAAPILKNSQMEVIPTGYVLVNSGRPTAASYISNTTPIPAEKYSIAASTALAGEMLGLKLIYLDAGSGAEAPVNAKMVSAVRRSVDAPLIVGGGINTPQKAQEALEAGADVIVIGNAIEKNPNLMIEVSEKVYDFNKSLNIH
ncbi:MAG: geranylgeranylglyceryl/heptaprenylglyceryl phosphate synthase [Bacteroidota bacterium]